MFGKIRCHACGRKFELTKDAHYIGRSEEVQGLGGVLGSHNEVELRDCFDCPHCGSQNDVGKRLRVQVGISIAEEVESILDDSDESYDLTDGKEVFWDGED